MDNSKDIVPWIVVFSSKAKKQRDRLPPLIRESMLTLQAELELEGPEQTEWHHYGQIVGSKNVYHCHLNKGHPRYVAVWKVTDREVQIIEIQYAGTHGKVDYSRFK
jgi:hypothetical protein